MSSTDGGAPGPAAEGEAEAEAQAALEEWDPKTAVLGRRYWRMKNGERQTGTARMAKKARHCTFEPHCKCGCGQRAQGNVTLQGYAPGCWTRINTIAAVAAARAANGGVLPAYKGERRETAGTYCQVNGVEGRAQSSGIKTVWRPFCACGACWALTRSPNWPYAVGCKEGPRCTRVVDGVCCHRGRAHGELCVLCYNETHHARCPTVGCGGFLFRGQCIACKRRAVAEGQRQAYVSAIDALVANGYRDGRTVNSWDAEFRVAYVRHNKQNGQRPHLVVRIGRKWRTACGAVDGGAPCGRTAQQSNDGTSTYCIRHGGGARCTSGVHSLDDGVAPYAGYTVSDACTQVPLRGVCVCLPCLRYFDPENIAVRVYVKKEDLALAGVAECLIEIGCGDMCIGRKARMVQDCATGKSKRRMDTDVPLPTDLVFGDLEIDENQHKDREQSCEQRKLVGHWIDKGAPQEVGASSSAPVPKLYVVRFNCDGYVDDQGVRHPSLFNRTGVQSEDELLKLEPVQPRFKEACMRVAQLLKQLHDDCTRPEFVDGLKSWTVVYFRYDGCRADGSDPGGVAEAVARRVVGAKETAQVEAYKRHAKKRKAEAGPSGA